MTWQRNNGQTSGRLGFNAASGVRNGLMISYTFYGIDMWKMIQGENYLTEKGRGWKEGYRYSKTA